MFSTLSYFHLQEYWWIIISLLGGILVFLMFVQGGQTMLYTLATDEEERAMLINALGRKWEYTFTTLVVFGGAIFAAFPLFYATSFGGAYWIWMIMLFCFILQAVSYEFRSKPKNIFGPRVYEVFLLVNGFLGTFILGALLGTFFHGSLFSVNQMHLSQWESHFHGLEAILNLNSLLLGLAVVFLTRILSMLFFMNMINDEVIYVRAQKQLLYNTVFFFIFILFFIRLFLVMDGFNYDPQTKIVSLETAKYFHNMVHLPLVGLMLVGGLVLIITGIMLSLTRHHFRDGIWYSGGGTILLICSLMILAGLNHTCYYPSLYNLQHSLTIENSSSSQYTLKVLGYVSLFLPFVMAYIVIAWRSITKDQMEPGDLDKEVTVY